MKKLIFLLLLLLIATPCFAQDGFRSVWECFESGDCKLISVPAKQQEARMSLGIVGGGVPVAGGDTINDTFTTDTSANYTAINQGIAVSGGLAHGLTVWERNMVYHNTTLGGANHYAQADIKWVLGDKSGVFARVDTGTPKTGYLAYILSNGKVYLYSFSGVTFTYIAEYDGGYSSNTFYTVKLSVSGTTIKVYVNGVERISITDSTYSTGNYIGLLLARDSDGGDITADNLVANP